MSLPSPSRWSRPGARLLLLAGLLLLAVNLRPAAVSVGPVLAEVRSGLSLSASEAGLLTSLPVLAFAAFGAAAPAVARRVGVHRTTMMALLALVTGLAGRAFAPGEATFLVLSMLALSGMAMANVLLPSLVKLHFPDRIGRVTALYTGGALGRPDRGADAHRAARRRRRGVALGPRRVGGAGAAGRLPWLWLVAHDRRGPTSRRTTSPSGRSPAPGWGWRWRSSSGSSRCRPTRSSAGSPSCGATRLLPDRRRACWSASSPRPASRSRCGCPAWSPGRSTRAGC